MEQNCPQCDCAVGLHDDDGCACEDAEGHPNTLVRVPDTDVDYCACLLTAQSFAECKDAKTKA